jgi:hypothetical protein
MVMSQFSIDFAVQKEGNELKKEITLHSKELLYAAASYKVPNGTSVAAEEIRVNLKAR